MQKIALIVSALIISGCSFGEYADSQKSAIENTATGDGYKFVAKNMDKKSFYYVSKKNKVWQMALYDFNKTHYTSNQIVGAVSRVVGEYNVTKEGYLNFTSLKPMVYIKATKEDSDKIFLLWTTNRKDLNKSVPTKDTYFFKSKDKADSFIK